MKLQYIICFTVLLATIVKAENDAKIIKVPFVKTSIKRNRSFLQERAVASDKLYNYANIGYLVSLNVGTPPQSFDVIVDTGRYIFIHIHPLVTYKTMVAPIPGYPE
jgi:hypothetical protein